MHGLMRRLFATGRVVLGLCEQRTSPFAAAMRQVSPRWHRFIASTPQPLNLDLNLLISDADWISCAGRCSPTNSVFLLGKQAVSERLDARAPAQKSFARRPLRPNPADASRGRDLL